MKNNMVLVVLISFIMLASIASAGSLNITVYNQKNLAHVVMSSSIEFLFKYPKNSMFSSLLANTSREITFTVNYSGPSQNYISFLEGFFKSHYKNVTIENLTLTYNMKEYANSTEMIAFRNVSMDLWLTGIFNKSKSNSVVNLSWRDIIINKNFNITYGNKQYDVNGFNFNYTQMGNYSEKFGMSSMPMMKMPKIWGFNYSVFAKPLKEWNRAYNKTLNETIFTLTIPPQIIFNQTFTLSNSTYGGMPFMNNITSNNFGNYSLEIITDPSANIAVQGYAVPNNNTVTVYSSPTTSSPTTQNNNLMTWIYIVIGIIIIALIVGAFMYMNSKKSKNNENKKE